MGSLLRERVQFITKMSTDFKMSPEQKKIGAHVCRLTDLSRPVTGFKNFDFSGG